LTFYTPILLRSQIISALCFRNLFDPGWLAC
jgi:hypothetical protein